MDFRLLAEKIAQQLEKASKVCIMGVGADLREDDAVGNYIARDLIEILKNHAGQGRDPLDYSRDEYIVYPGVMILNASVVPEQYVSFLQRHGPDLIIIIDAAKLGANAMAGDVALVSFERMKGAFGSTHTIPLHVFRQWLELLGVTSEFIVLGIQPKLLDYGEELSPEVEGTRQALRDMLFKLVEPRLQE